MTRPTYPPAARLRRKAEFLRVLRQGRVYPGAQCLVRIVPNEMGRPRLGVAAPRRYGKSVRRNRFRRLVREAFRLAAADLGTCDYLVAPRKGLVEPTLAGIRADLLAAGQGAFQPRGGGGRTSGRRRP